jgi:hypothetical protein
LADITHIESDSEYVNSTSNGRKIMSYQTLKSLEKTLDPNQFIRVHRSFIVNKNKVTGLKGRDFTTVRPNYSVTSYYDKGSKIYCNYNKKKGSRPLFSTI